MCSGPLVETERARRCGGHVRRGLCPCSRFLQLRPLEIPLFFFCFEGSPMEAGGRDGLMETAQARIEAPLEHVPTGSRGGQSRPRTQVRLPCPPLSSPHPPLFSCSPSSHGRFFFSLQPFGEEEAADVNMEPGLSRGVLHHLREMGDRNVVSGPTCSPEGFTPSNITRCVEFHSVKLGDNCGPK